MSTVSSLLHSSPVDKHNLPKITTLHAKLHGDATYWAEKGWTGWTPGEAVVVFPQLDGRLHCTRLQAGPSCGLIAAWIASDTLGGDTGTGDAETAAALLVAAQAHCGPDNQGEMFDGRILGEVAREVLPVDVTHCWLQTEDGAIALVHHVLRGGAALVPYDVDASGDPTEAGGAKAHWCAIVGVVTRSPVSNVDADADADGAAIVTRDGPLPDPLPGPDEVLLVLLQPKSRHVRFVAPRALFASSKQLTRACEAVGAFSIEESLAGRALLLCPATPGAT
mmetsp:Transcript_1942/g.6148  ORF Transcript_1942/g.6148 Transcript_1942/m.6148 type:complete len:279 (+) Transcript_1942:57-893(+)